MPAPLPVHASVEVDAPVPDVWAVVSDLARMPEWSPELRRLWLLGRGGPRVGTTLLGVNRRGLAVWPTTSRLVRLEPPRAVAWHTRESGATWTYELEDVEGRTRLTARRDLPAFSRGTTVLGPLIGGAQGHDRELAEGLRLTLQRIKATIEATQRA